MPTALKVAFRTGGVAGMFTVGLGLLGATIIIMIFQNTSSAILIGFGFGGSLLALFLRVGGGIFTKAADVGADLVGKVEAGIPEDDPRNPATIADNVGDNVGDCAGMAADLFESYEVTLVASIILGVPAFQAIFPHQPALWAIGALFPLAARAIGVLASIVGVFAVKATDKDKSAMAPINRGFLTAGILTIIGTLVLALVYVGNPSAARSRTSAGACSARSSAVSCSRRSRRASPSTSRRPRPSPCRRSRSRRPPAARRPRCSPASAAASSRRCGRSSPSPVRSRSPSRSAAATSQFSLYLVALTGMGMLATTGVVVSEDTFGPVADNAAGIAEMSGEFEGEPQRIMVSLDAVGNTTKAVTKGFAIGSAVIAAVALFSSFIETIRNELPDLEAISGNDLFTQPARRAINVADPKTFIGLLIGGSIAFLFSSLAIRAVGRTANVVVQEVRQPVRRRQDHERREAPRLRHRSSTSAPQASLRELATPALLAVLTPVIIGFGINYFALGAFLAAVILTGQLMANFLSNSGGAWDNAKKYIEDGHYGGKGIRRLPRRGHRRHDRRPVQGHRRPGAQPADQGDEPGLVADPAGGHHPAEQLRRPVQHRGRGARRADRRDPVLEAGRRDVAGRRSDRGDRTRGRGRQLTTATGCRRAALRGGPSSFVGPCDSARRTPALRLCLRYSRNGGISDRTMITATIG